MSSVSAIATTTRRRTASCAVNISFLVFQDVSAPQDQNSLSQFLMLTLIQIQFYQPDQFLTQNILLLATGMRKKSVVEHDCQMMDLVEVRNKFALVSNNIQTRQAKLAKSN